MHYRFIFRLVYNILSVIASIISSIILPTQKSYAFLRTILCVILYVFNTHDPIYPTLYIPLEIPPGDALEGPFLISVKLNSRQVTVYPVDNRINVLTPAVFNLSEIKTGVKCCLIWFWAGVFYSR